MKLPALLSAVLAIAALAPPSFATDYADLVAKGYRWSSVNGPYAYVTKEDAKNGGSRFAKLPESQIIDHAYFLRPGKLVLVVETDAAVQLSKIRVGGIASDLWTRTTNLSTRPVTDALGIIETPDTPIIIKIPSATPSPSSSAKAAHSVNP